MRAGQLAAAVAALGLALAGCGDDEKSNRDKAYTPPPKPTQQAATGDAARQDAEAKAQARELATGVEACYVDQQTYEACTEPEGVNVPIGSAGGQAEVSEVALAAYTVAAHSKSGNSFEIAKGDDGSMSRTCEKPGNGGCPASGKW
jgi:hypothetical protein